MLLQEVFQLKLYEVSVKVVYEMLKRITTASTTILTTLYNLQYECNAWSNKKDFPVFHELNDTLDILKTGTCSISRFGDGEFLLMNGVGLRFQSYDVLLAKRLSEVLVSKCRNHEVGIPPYFFSLKGYPYAMKRYLRRFLYKYRVSISAALDSNKEYYDTSVSQYYALVNDVTWLEKYFYDLRQIWDNKSIVIVKGIGSESDQMFDIYDNAASVEYVYAASENAFSEYDMILHKLSGFSNKCMMILALGPTATVLSHDLSQLGYIALDLGHLAKSYDWFKRGKIIGETKEKFFPV